MSDPEDLQSDEKQNDPWIYQLRRIGPPATCPKIPDVMRLKKGLTRIGRGQHNDFFLDSAVLKNFISRSHVEIFGNQNENGEIDFVLTDKGLNGTFINDIRTHKTCTLELESKITFGHTNGYKIQPGSYAEQPLSEFQFVFERIPRKPDIYSGNLSTNSTSPCDDSNDLTTDLKNDTTIVPSRLSLSNIESNVVQTQEKNMKSKISKKGRNRKESSSHSDSDNDFYKDTSPPKAKSETGKRNVDHSFKPSSSESVPVTGKSRKSANTEKQYEEPDLPPDDEIDEIEDTAEEEVEVKKKKKGVKKGKTIVTKKTLSKKKVVVEPQSDSEESSEDDSCKPEADQRHRAPIISKQKQPKRKKTGNDAPAKGSRKRRRKGGPSSSSATASTSDDLEPGVEWYEDDTCDSADCKRPKKKRTPWVQCDDCDGWYHTVCVGANYKKLKDSDEHFNCGCE